MPRNSRHRSHRSHRRVGSAERSESEGEDVGGPGAREETTSVARVPRDPEPERRRSSSGKEVVSSGNGYVEHGKKRKDRVEEMVVDVVSDRWNSGVCEDHLVEKRSKSEVFGPVDVEKLAEKPKGSGDESKRSSRRAVGLDERVEEVVSKSDSGKRRPEKEKDLGRRESSGQYKDDRDRERDREKEKEWERLKERERERGRDRERDKERERERDKERDRERERERDRERERERQKDREREKKDYDSKHERYEDGSARKGGSKTSRAEDDGYSYKRHMEINETPAKERYSNPDRETDKHSRRKDDSEDKDKWPTDNRDSDDRKTLSRYDHGKVRSSKEQRFDDDKYKQKCKDDYERDKRQQDDKCLDERLTRDHGGDRADYKSTKDGHRISEGHYRKDIVQDVDRYDDYGSRYKENRGRKRPPEENDDQYDLKTPSAREPRGNLEKSSGSGRLDSLIERARSEHRHPENVDSSPSKIHASSPSSNPHHEKDQSWHGSKLTDHTKREIPYDERSIRPRTSSGRERTPASRLRDRDTDNWSSERLKHKDDLQSRDIPLEISASSQYDRTPRKDSLPSPKQLSEKSPSSNDQRFSGRLSGGRSLDNKGERSILPKYRDRDGDLTLERPLHQDRTPARIPYREPTPSASSISRGGHFSGTSPNHPLLPPARHRGDDSSFLGSHDDDRRPQSGDRRFHGHQKRNDMSSGRGHGHAWNNAPSWPSPVANGFVPMQHGAAGFHPPVHQFHPPPMFNLRPQMKLNQPGVSYPMHDAVDRFPPHMRPFGWPNSLDESCPPHLQVWNGGGGVFGGEPYMYGRQEWDQNKLHAGSRGWEPTGDALKGQNESPDTELPVAKREPDCLATSVSESSGGQYNVNPYAEQKEIDHFISEKNEAKDDTKSAIKNLEARQGTTLRASMLSSNDSAVFSKNYLSRISVSHDLAEPELYKRCISLLGDLGIGNGGPQVVRNGLIQNDGNAGKITGKHGSPNLLGSFCLKSNNTIFQRAMALHKNQTEKAVAPTQVFVQTDGKMDLTEDNHDGTEMMDHTPPKESTVSKTALHCPADIMERTPLKPMHGDGMGVTTPAITESGDVDASPAIAESCDVEMPPAVSGLQDTEMVARLTTTGRGEDTELVALPAITEPDKNIDDVSPPAMAVPADGAPQVITEHVVGSQEAPSAPEELGDAMEIVPPAVTEQPGRGEDSPAVGSPPGGQETVSIMHAGVDKGMQGDADKVIDDNPGDGEVNASDFVSELDVVARGAQDCEGLLVEKGVNLSRIPNSPESTH